MDKERVTVGQRRVGRSKGKRYDEMLEKVEN